ncbi:MAG: 50S ribosomal protein L32 [Candidatus Latescibacterota bacterium]|nr:50S ribosomal protein L32 [Candidatus Latescibacterota bacterium]RKY65640.1 MAG: 50S ribosomal protein L32 [Candidatus Latescibacterota bacterium]
MALPRRKISKARRDKRRTHWKLTAPTVVECSNCSQPKMPHRICPNCGYYNGRKMITPREG